MSADVLRTPATIKRYRAARKEKRARNLKFLTPLWEGKYWIIAKNDFPYDLITDQHDLLVPKRVFSESWQATTC